ncbi:MAG: DpnI domain-containing protein [bacterium]
MKKAALTLNQITGGKGEREVVRLINCPNCLKKLLCLPKNYPLYDLQCSGCSFRTQVKSVNRKPSNQILGAGWTVIEKVLKSGFIVPPLIVNFCWLEKSKKRQEIRFYPFIPKTTLKKYQLSKKAVRADYKMFRYTQLKSLPHFVLFRK